MLQVKSIKGIVNSSKVRVLGLLAASCLALRGKSRFKLTRIYMLNLKFSIFITFNTYNFIYTFIYMLCRLLERHPEKLSDVMAVIQNSERQRLVNSGKPLPPKGLR